MKRILLIPDSFKSTMTSFEVCGLMADAIRHHYPKADIVSVPVADGGEGSVDAFLLAVGGQRIEAIVQGPFGEEMTSFFGSLPDGTAVIEMAACAGLPLALGRLAPELATTYGVGQLMVDAAQHGASRLIVGLGGSCTNDGGCGAAAAAGIKFIDRLGWPFVPTGQTLVDIARIDVGGLLPLFRDVSIVGMCDIDNPMFGPNGAAHIFGPQKGADPAMVEKLDTGLRHLARQIKHDLGIDVDTVPGGGAAGAMGAGLVAFFGASLQPGIEAVLDAVDFTELSKGADLVLTGEGKFDSQSLRGKVVIGVARRAQASGIPVVAVVGDIGEGIDEAYRQGITAIVSTNRRAVDFEVARATCREDLTGVVDNLMRCFRLAGW